MFDKLIDLIVQFIDHLCFWVVIDPYERAVLLRLGKFVKILEPGFHFMIPFGIDKYLHESVVPSTHSLGNESITTRDGKAVSFHAIVTYQVSDIKKAILEVHDTDHAVRDACAGEIGRVLREHTWEEILLDGILDDLTKACRKRGWKYGIEIMSVQLSGLSLAKTLRIIDNH